MNINGKNYIILIKAVNKYTSSTNVIGFTDNSEDAAYIFNNLKFKTFQVKGDYLYDMELIPVEGNIQDNVSIVYIGSYKDNLLFPICGYETYAIASDKAKEIDENNVFQHCALNYVEKLSREWADNFKQPPEYSWN